MEKDQQLTPIVNINKASNRKTITAAEIEDDLEDLDEMDDEITIKKSNATKMQTRLSSTAYESPAAAASTTNKTKSSNVRKSIKKTIEEDDEINNLSENDEIVASSAGDILTQSKQFKTIEIETINRSKSIFKNKSINKTSKNNEKLPEAINFAPGNLSRKKDKSTNKTPAKQENNKKKLTRQNRIESDDDDNEQVEKESPQVVKNKNSNKNVENNKTNSKLQQQQNQPKSKVIEQSTNQSVDSDDETKDKNVKKSNDQRSKLSKSSKQKEIEPVDDIVQQKPSKKSNKKVQEPVEEKEEINQAEDDEYEYSIAGDRIQEEQQIDDIQFEDNNDHYIEEPVESSPPLPPPTEIKLAKTTSRKSKKIESDDEQEQNQQISSDNNQQARPFSSSSKISIVKTTNVKSKQKQIVEEDAEKVMPPPPPLPVETSDFSAESSTTNRRRSARLESTNSTNSRITSSAITDIKVNLMPPNRSQRNLTRQISNLNNNNIEDIASTTQDIQDEQELMQSQNTKFIRKSMTKTINSTTGNNQTVNASTASSLFKSKQALLSAQIPTAPLFNSAKPTSSNINNKNNKKNSEQSQDEQENNNNSNVSNKKKVSAAKSSTKNNKKQQIIESEKSQDEIQDDQQIQKSPSPVKQQKRHALKDIDVNKQRKTKRQKSIESSPASVPNMKKKPTSNRKQRQQEQVDPVIEPLSQESNFEEDHPGLRRSKRAKIDKNSKAVYHYSPIKDYTGNTIYIQKIIGTTVKTDQWTKYIKDFSEQKKINEKKRKHNALLKEHGYENEVQKNNKKTKRIANRKQLNEDDSMNDENNRNSQENNYHHEHYNNDNDNILRKEIILNTQDNPNASQTLLLDSDMSNINMSQESVVIQDPGTTILDSSKITTEHLYCYEKLNERKQYDECKTGVSIAASSNNSGVLRIDPTYSTKTNAHAMRVVYFVQRGECLVSINNIISKHSAGDVIKVPANISYKVKNIAKDKNDKLYLYFQFLEQS